MEPCESKRSYEGKHVFCGGADSICVLCLRRRCELERQRPVARDGNFCPGAFHGKHVFVDGECAGCGRSLEENGEGETGDGIGGSGGRRGQEIGPVFSVSNKG